VGHTFLPKMGPHKDWSFREQKSWEVGGDGALDGRTQTKR
jgi:hypothetical protein